VAAAVPAYGLNEAAADFTLIVVVAVNCFMGWRFGLVRRAIAFVAVFGGTVAATYIGNPLASVIRSGSLYTNAWSFVAVFVIVVVMIEILAALYGEQLQKVDAVVFDRFTGVVAGVIVGVLEVGVLCLVAQAVANVQPTTTTSVPPTHTEAATAVDNGLLTQFVVRLEPGIQTLLSPVLPSNLSNQLDQGTNPLGVSS
jgi:uncharacterized membrane protein required for colicin V production